MGRMYIQLFIEISNRWSVQRFCRQEGMVGDFIQFHYSAAFTGQDQYFAHYVHTAEVYTWIWFRVSFILGCFHYLAEVSPIHEVIEHKVEASAENSFNATYFITTAN